MFHLFSHCWSWLQAIQEPIRKRQVRSSTTQRQPQTQAAALWCSETKGPRLLSSSRCSGGVCGARPCPGQWERGRGCGRRGTGHRDAPGPLCQLSALSPHAALAGEVLPDAQPGRSRLRLDRFEVTLLDLPGAQRSRSAWRSHYSEAHGLLFVLDSGDLARMEEARKVLSRVLSHPDVSGKPLLLLANKQDAAAALLPCELIERLCLERLVNENRSPCRIEPCVAKRVPPARPARATLQGLRWLLRAAAAAPAPPDASPVPPAPRAARRDRPPAGEDAREGAGKSGEPRPVRPVCRLLPLEESTKGPRRRKRKVKVKKKGLGQPSPAEEPEGAGVGAAGGLLLPNRVGQEEPIATPHPAQGMKKKKKKKIKNKIKSREPSLEQQHEEISSTFDLYRRAMLALKMRQEQRKQPSAVAP
ncbi:ADP-ribosylation factor-like protein 13A [Vidua chalybeata]|uniref:ADP-ribosylation factor-like protein 13A n=1 Tax=Vidua chalybeata TaxID=81927 RepID=UPI0023A8CCDC|nr:ADP-ribosylation factor-like protein 13A [Vidua chalybeata]